MGNQIISKRLYLKRNSGVTKLIIVPFLICRMAFLLFNTELLRKEIRKITHTFFNEIVNLQLGACYATEKTEENYFSVKNSIQNFEIVNPINAHCHVQVRFNKSWPCMSQLFSVKQ